MAVKPIMGPAALSPEWREARTKCLTATDIARIKTGEGMAVYGEHIGVIAPFEGNEVTELGNDLQDGVLRNYGRRKAVMIDTPLPLYYAGDLPILAATPDAMATPKYEVAGALDKWGVEAKTTASREVVSQLGDEDSDFVPDKWFWQCHTQMAVMGWKLVDVAALVYGRLRTFSIPRDEEIVGMIKALASDFWDRVQRRQPPDPDFGNPTTPDAIRAIYPIRVGERVALMPDAADLWAERAKLKAVEAGAAAAAKARKIIDAKLVVLMGGASIGVLPDMTMIERKKIKRAGYSVADCEYEVLSERKSE